MQSSPAVPNPDQHYLPERNRNLNNNTIKRHNESSYSISELIPITIISAIATGSGLYVAYSLYKHYKASKARSNKDMRNNTGSTIGNTGNTLT